MFVPVPEGVVADDGHPVDDQPHPIIEMVLFVLEAFLRVPLDWVDGELWLGPGPLGLVEVLEEIGGLAMRVFLRGVVARGGAREEEVGGHFGEELGVVGDQDEIFTAVVGGATGTV